MSLLKEHLWLTDLIKSGRFLDAKTYMGQHKISFKDLCAPENKHCVTHPVYAAIYGLGQTHPSLRATSGGKEFLKEAVESAPQLLDIVDSRTSILSYQMLNYEDPELSQYLINKKPALLNDQSDYTNPKDQTSEFSSTFKLYKPSLNSPTHNVVMMNKLQSLDLLIKNGANVNLKNITKVTPLDRYFINCNKLDISIPSKLTSAGGDVTTTATYSTYIGAGINNKCWTGLNKVLPTSKAPMNVFQFNDIINKATLPNGSIDKEAVTTAYLALPHLAKDFDVKKYGEVNCLKQPIINSENCKKVISEVMDMQHDNTLHSTATADHSDL